MAYVAMHFVKVNGRMFTRGEIIDEPMNEEKEQWLLESGAIQTMEVPEKQEAAEAPKEAPKAKAPKAAPAVKKQAVPEEPKTEADDSAEAPEIDIMDGIVGAKKTKARRKTK